MAIIVRTSVNGCSAVLPRQSVSEDEVQSHVSRTMALHCYEKHGDYHVCFAPALSFGRRYSVPRTHAVSHVASGSTAMKRRYLRSSADLRFDQVS